MLKGSVGSSRHQTNYDRPRRYIAIVVQVSYYSFWSKVTAPKGNCTQIRSRVYISIIEQNLFLFLYNAKTKAAAPLAFLPKNRGSRSTTKMNSVCEGRWRAYLRGGNDGSIWQGQRTADFLGADSRTPVEKHAPRGDDHQLVFMDTRYL